jgi:hypothetical protein
MLVYNTPEPIIDQAADRTGVEIIELKHQKNSISFKLRPVEQADGYRKYGKCNPVTGRKIHAVCWHGWEEFLSNLWNLSPTARVKTHKGFFNSFSEFTAGLDEMDDVKETQGQKYRASEACLCNGR